MLPEENMKIQWHGKWVWIDNVAPRKIQHTVCNYEHTQIEQEEMNIFTLLRHHLTIKDHLISAQIDITADSRYKLFVNGKYVGRGISRCESYYWYYNSYDLTPFLQSGENVIAIHARFYGKELAYYRPIESPGEKKEDAGKGGVLFDIALVYTTEENQQRTEFCGSGSSTLIIHNDAQKSKVEMKGCTGFVEEFDSQKQPQAWNEIGFDDGNWKPATEYDYPIHFLIPDPNAPLFEKEILPSKFIHIGEFEDGYYDLEPEEIEQVDFNTLHVIDGEIESTEKVENEDFLLDQNRSDRYCVINPPGTEKGISILLQFPEEMVGYPRLIIEGGAGTIVDLLNCEKIRREQLDFNFIEGKRGSRLVLRGGKQFFEQWDWEGFQYLQIKIRNLTEPLKIWKLTTNITHMNTNEQTHGSFGCSDEKLTALWQACARTLLCCGVDGYLDCPQREQRSYLGDAYVEALVAQVCFGDHRLTRKIILDAAYGQRKDGITYSFHPGDYQRSRHILSDYSLYWIELAWMYYEYTKDQEILHRLYAPFLKAIDWFWMYLNPDTHLLRDVPFGFFIDWAYKGKKPDYNAIYNAQYCDCLEIVQKIAQMRGDNFIIQKYSKQIEQMREIIPRIFWDSDQRCYRDSSDGNKPFGLISQHTNSYLILKGYAPSSLTLDECANLIHKRIFIDASITLENTQINMARPPKGFLPDESTNLDEFILFAMPFFMHFVHRFLARQGDFSTMLRYFRKGWIPMLENGTTGTIWETFGPNQSLCHAWSATPAYDLSSYWLGIKPLEPGFDAIELSPSFEGLDWVEGTYPTRHGGIKIRWNKQMKEDKIFVNLNMDIPKAITQCILRIPVLNSENRTWKQVQISEKITANQNQDLQLDRDFTHKSTIEILY